MLLDLIVQIHNVQNIQQLTLIFVKSLDLHIKDGRRIHIDSIIFFDIFCKAYLVLIFDLHKFFSCALIIYQRLQVADQG